ncbi:hypothetical protein [Weissella soli]|jgi:hypothetical protein|uniref:Uncharacterized protein n=1 Tax=Weissella soli TaxID=155866 RepID=A0A288QBT2_9LACO|nr:hypothetical protein [Weissella soli]AOT56722.1 hypothetical protein WSWS_01093 [Weissella soli]RDL12284.1 hypothetical protein DFP99_0722 [Weissella soli]GEN92471.1 hypothetical protein WSO01_00830 [Weissella soli]GJM48574.1 hypothetical protein WSSLDB02_11310 [Weissella soli]
MAYSKELLEETQGHLLDLLIQDKQSAEIVTAVFAYYAENAAK